MINNIIIILLILNYIVNSLYILKYYQSDNYHNRIFIKLFKKSIVTEPYYYLLIGFVFVKKTLIVNISLIIILLILILEKIVKCDLKLVKTKRMIRLLIIVYLPFILFLLFNRFINGLLIINFLILSLTFIKCLYANLIENILIQKFYKEAQTKVDKYNPFIIGITGSCGKTSIKNYLYSCLNETNIVYKSPKSYNTLKGLSITINKYLKSYNNLFILEMGLSHKKDIYKITKRFKPNISIITEILPSHLETMKSIDNIINEKMQIIANMKDNGLIIANYDNEYIKNNISKYNINNNKIIKIGSNKENDYYFENLLVKTNGISFNLVEKENNNSYFINSCLIGRHNVYNILIVFAVLKSFNMEKKQIIDYLSQLQNYENRLEVKKYNELTILNDSYNANINGFINALEVLSLYDTEKYIITPGIVESGKKNEEIIEIISEKIVRICDFCYLINNKNTPIFEKHFKKLNFSKYCIKKTFKDAFNEVKNKKITLLIENDLTDFYYL